MPQNIAEWKKSFEIFEKYPSGADGLAGAEHDEVFASVNPEEVSEEDLLELEKLGWNADESGDGLQAFV